MTNYAGRKRSQLLMNAELFIDVIVDNNYNIVIISGIYIYIYIYIYIAHLDWFLNKHIIYNWSATTPILTPLIRVLYNLLV